MKLVIDCPPPPSTNRLWRYGRGHVYRSPEYERWRREFHYHFLFQYPVRPPMRKEIKGPFDVEILVSSKRRDVDNNAKALLDICENLEIIENDKLARRVVQERVEKDKAPLGCRLILIPLENKDAERKDSIKKIQTKKTKSRAEETGTSKAPFAGSSNRSGKKEGKPG